MNNTQWYEFHLPHLTNVVTLPCESRNTENVMLQRDIIKKMHQMYHSFVEMYQDAPYILLI